MALSDAIGSHHRVARSLAGGEIDPAQLFKRRPLKRGLRNPITALFSLAENRCSENTDIRNTLEPSPSLHAKNRRRFSLWNDSGGPALVIGPSLRLKIVGLRGLVTRRRTHPRAHRAACMPTWSSP
jgi:hypothetical protein